MGDGEKAVGGGAVVLLLMFVAALAGSSNPPLNVDVHEMVAGELPYTGIGGDYLVTYSNGDPTSVWTGTNTNWLTEWKAKGYHTSRLGFAFSGATPTITNMSTLDYDKFDTVLGIFNSVGVKVVPVLQNWHESYEAAGTGYTMSVHFYNSWVQFAQYYRNDSRIAAISLFSETDENTMGTGDPATAAERLAQTRRYADLTNHIHSVDPDRIVIFPFAGLYYDYDVAGANAWIADLTTVGIINDPKVVFDVVHPYYFENADDMGLTPAQKAAWYVNNWVRPCVNAFGASRCWCGETFGCYATTGYTEGLQVAWLTAIINQFVAQSVGFDVWAFFGAPMEKVDWNTQGMDASDYPTDVPDEEPPNPPPPPTYSLTIQAATGCTTIPTGTQSNLPLNYTVNVTCVPDSDYAFQYWLLDGANAGGANPITVTMYMDHTLQPVLYQIPGPTQYVLSVYQSVGGSTVPANGSYVYDSGAAVSVVATADENWTFSKWQVDGADSAETSTTLSLTMSANYTVRAFFTYTEPSPPEENPEQEPGPAQIPANASPAPAASSYSTLLNTVQATFAAKGAPDYSNTVTVLEETTPKTFAEVLAALEKVKL